MASAKSSSAKESNEENKKSGKIYKCGFCGAACDDYLTLKRTGVYMGRPTNELAKSHFCNKNCSNASVREEFSLITKDWVKKLKKNIDGGREAYHASLTGKGENKILAEVVITTFTYLTSKLAYLKALYARKPREELELNWFKYRKYTGEMMENNHENSELLSKFANEIAFMGSECIIEAYAGDY